MLRLDLIQEKPALQTEFLVSLAADMFSTMSLVHNPADIEGFDQWVYTTHSALTDDMLVDMTAILILGNKSGVYTRWVKELPRDAAAHRDFAAYIGWLNSLPVSRYQDLISGFERMLDKHCATLPDIAADSVAEKVRACYDEYLNDRQAERLLTLHGDAVELKAQVISVITRFWEQFYREDFSRHLAMMDRSAAYHVQQGHTGELPTVFVSVTGRRFPKEDTDFERAERVIFVPSSHIGPYVMVSPCADDDTELMIHYNCRPTGAVDSAEAPAIQDLFPPLKALADETRLQILALLSGRELYAQQIVEALDISQSAVSRHLKLMVTGGILDVRREESMKYYVISERVLAALSEKLQTFRAG